MKGPKALNMNGGTFTMSLWYWAFCTQAGHRCTGYRVSCKPISHGEHALENPTSDVYDNSMQF